MTEYLPYATARTLGELPVAASPLAWGMWRFKGDSASATRLAETALDAGITLFDTAAIYGLDSPAGFGGAESLFGQVLRAAPALRDRIILATKAGIIPGIPYDSSPGQLIGSCEASLQRLGVETIDLFQIHRPDILTPPAAIAAALTLLREQGKIREAGVSNYSLEQTRALQKFLPFPLVSIQPEFSPLRREPMHDGLFDHAMAENLAVLAWSPLGGGRLGGGDAETATLVTVLERIARDQGVDRAAVIYAWIMAHPAHPIPILGTQNPQRLSQARQALQVKLDRAAWYEILVAAQGAPLP